MNKRAEESLDLKRAGGRARAGFHYGLKDVEGSVSSSSCRTVSCGKRSPDPVGAGNDDDKQARVRSCCSSPPGRSESKTSIAKSISRAPWAGPTCGISLGAPADEADIRGHRVPYVGRHAQVGSFRA